MHVPVLLQTVIDQLDLAPNLTVVDATVNGGGHSAEIAKRLSSAGYLIGIDRDINALRAAAARLGKTACQLSLLRGNFRDLKGLLDRIGVAAVDRILFDLGFSSNQLSDSGRGFSFQNDEPLLMTYEAEPEVGQLTARQILNNWSESRLAELFRDYGAEPYARQIAESIVRKRREQEFETTSQLVETIRRAVPAWYRSPKRRRHFATKVFQALRVAVNDEVVALVEGLTSAWQCLKPAGRLAVISFQGDEARIVKNFFRTEHGLLITKKAIRPTYEETRVNPRARSATLRIIKKI